MCAHAGSVSGVAKAPTVCCSVYFFLSSSRPHSVAEQILQCRKPNIFYNLPEPNHTVMTVRVCPSCKLKLQTEARLVSALKRWCSYAVVGTVDDKALQTLGLMRTTTNGIGSIALFCPHISLSYFFFVNFNVFSENDCC